MATTNWDSATAFQDQYPHTFNALQHLVAAMADLTKVRGKRPLFGRDRELVALQKFESKRQEAWLALALDGVIKGDEDSERANEALLAAIRVFAEAFPNWADAYQFAEEYFGAPACSTKASQVQPGHEPRGNVQSKSGSDTDSNETLYDALAASPYSTHAEILAMYRQSVQRWHSDKLFGYQRATNERLKRINSAAKILTNPHKRILYDQEIGILGSSEVKPRLNSTN